MTPEDIAVHLARHDERLEVIEKSRLEVVEKGVSNFRIFQGESREFYAEQRAFRKAREEAELKAEKERKDREDRAIAKSKERRSNRIAVASIIVVLFLPPAGWISAKVVHYANEMYQIMQEWETVHKSEIQQKKRTGEYDPAYASSKHKQVATE